MSYTVPAWVLIFITILPTVIALATFKLFDLSLKASLRQTLTINALIFGIIGAVVPYLLVFGTAHGLGFLNFQTPILKLLGQNTSLPQGRMLVWCLWLVVYYAVCFGWFSLLAWAVAISLEIDFASSQVKCFSKVLGRIGSFLSNILVKLELQDEFLIALWRKSAGTRIEVDIALKGDNTVYSGILEGRGDGDTYDGKGLIVTGVLKIPLEFSRWPPEKIIEELKKEQVPGKIGGAENEQTPNKIEIWDSRGLLNRMVFPWESISNINLRKTRDPDYTQNMDSVLSQLKAILVTDVKG